MKAKRCITAPTTTLTSFEEAKLNLGLAQRKEFVNPLTQLKEKVFGGA
jgi:hypothetical protein